MPTPVEQWVEECAQLTRPKDIYWCDGSEAEYQGMVHDMLETGTLLELNQQEYPGCYLHRSDPTDVARTEHLTYVCTGERDDAGPNNNWMAPTDAKARLAACLRAPCGAGLCTWCRISWGQRLHPIARSASS